LSGKKGSGRRDVIENGKLRAAGNCLRHRFDALLRVRIRKVQHGNPSAGASLLGNNLRAHGDATVSHRGDEDLIALF
jgi:hypothetical protein